MRVLPFARGALCRWVDLFSWALGGTLLLLGLHGRPGLSLAGSLLLTAVGVLHVARGRGHVMPRPGWRRIATFGCWDTPLAFFVRHRGLALLFHRAFDAAGGNLPDKYCVVALPGEWGEEFLISRAFEPPEDSRLVGYAPVRDLRFQHRGGDFVETASLAAALKRSLQA